jgi:ABC transporter substrate binding protein (PQQ-dependent alcohol dehydrogenase system)
MDFLNLPLPLALPLRSRLPFLRRLPLPLTSLLLMLSLLSLSALPAVAQTVRIAHLELEADPRYAETRLAQRGLMQPRGRPYAAAEVALRESRFAGKARGVEFALQRASAPDAAALVQAIDRLAGEGVQYFLLDAPGAVVAQVARETRGRKVVLFNVSARDDELRQQQCQRHLLHTIPHFAMEADALAQFLVSKKWRNVLMLAGPSAEDKLAADAFERSAKRFGLKIAERRPFALTRDPRQRDLGNVALLTAGGDHDVVFIADSDGEFAREVPYRTVRARPVVGAEGLVPAAWHWAWERHGAPQLNGRVEKHAGRQMTDVDWAAWIAVKAVVESVVRSESAEFGAVESYLRSDTLTLDGFKGNRLNFRPWDNQLRQPLLLATHNAVIERAPIAGFMHPVETMDTLGFDRRDSTCAF